MARRGQSLRELARLANVAGDMRAAKFYEGKRKGAEALLSKMTDKAKKAASGDYKGEKFVEAAKFLGKFIPGIGTAVSTAASAYDAYADKKHAKDKTEKFKNLRSQLPKGMYGDYLSQNFDALLSQVEQSQKASANKSLLSNLLGIGVGTGAVDKLSDPIQKTLEQYLPQLELRSMIPGEKILGDKLKKGLSSELSEYSMSDLSSMGLTEKRNLPSLFDYFQLLEPQVMKMIRGSQEAISPQAPYMQRPSLRRRIR